MAELKNDNKAQWVKPELTNLDAGSAETGFQTVGDNDPTPGTALS